MSFCRFCCALDQFSMHRIKLIFGGNPFAEFSEISFFKAYIVIEIEVPVFHRQSSPCGRVVKDANL